jgi:hypothetical protein
MSGEKRSRLLALIAVALFLAHGLWLGSSLPVWHEEVSTHANRTSELVVVPHDQPEATPTIGPSCASSHAPLLLRSRVRPVASLCVDGLSWPLLVSPYAAGVTYWPLQLLRPVHHGDPVGLRFASLLIGVLSLFGLYRLVARYRDEPSAAATVLVASVLSSFLHLHSLLVVYEHVPTLLLIAAVLVLDGRPELPLSQRRLALTGALAGLAVASNIKALVVGAPLLGLVMWRSPRARALGRPDAIVFAAALGLVAAPFIALALSDPFGGVSGQLSQRAAALLANLHPAHLLAEIDNALIFFTDFGFYMDVAAGEPAPLPLGFRVLPALALGYATFALVQFIRRREANLVAAACGAVLWTFIVFVALFYRQTPAANYGPIVHVHAIALAMALVDGGRMLGKRWPERASVIVASVVALGLGTLAWATHRHGDRRDHMAASIDVHALTQLSTWLRENDDQTRVVITTYNLVGVLDAMAASERPTLAVHDVLRCPEQEPSCRVERLARFLQTTDEPLRFVVPVRVVPIDERGADGLAREVCEAAQATGRTCIDELRVATRAGVDVLGVLRVDGESR